MGGATDRCRSGNGRATASGSWTTDILRQSQRLLSVGMVPASSQSAAGLTRIDGLEDARSVEIFPGGTHLAAVHVDDPPIMGARAWLVVRRIPDGDTILRTEVSHSRVVISRDGNELHCSSAVWDVTTGKQLFQRPVGGGVFIDDGRRLLALVTDVRHEPGRPALRRTHWNDVTLLMTGFGGDSYQSMWSRVANNPARGCTSMLIRSGS